MENNTEVKKTNILGKTKLVIIVLVAFILFTGSIVVTYPNEYNVIKQFGQIVDVKDNAGLSFKMPFIQGIKSIPKNVRLYDIPISEVITRDKKSMVVDCIVLWRVTDAEKFIRNLNGDISYAETRISNIAYNSMKNIISGMDQQDMISGRDKLAEKVRLAVGDSLDTYGVEMVGFETKRNDLPDANKSAVYNRMITERENIAAKFKAEGEEEAKKIKNETDKEVEISLSVAKAEAASIKAEGEREYMKILAEAYNSPEKAKFYNFTRALESAKQSLKNSNNTLILDKNSPIAQVFYNMN